MTDTPTNREVSDFLPCNSDAYSIATTALIVAAIAVSQSALAVHHKRADLSDVIETGACALQNGPLDHLVVSALIDANIDLLDGRPDRLFDLAGGGVL